MESGTRKICENQKCRSTETPFVKKSYFNQHFILFLAYGGKDGG